MFLLLTIGLVYPALALTFGAIHFVCRWIFVFGYKKGPNWRLAGGLPINLSLMAMMAFSVISMLTWINQLPQKPF